MKSKVGDFLVQATDVATTTIPITGVGFTPKALMVWNTGRSDAANAAGRSDAFPSVGYAGGPTDRVMSCGKMEDAQGTTDTARMARDDSIAALISPSDTVDGLLDLDSFDADGFTVIVDTQFAIDLRFEYMVLGGDDIINVITGNFLQPVSTGNQSISGLGFMPDIVLWTGVASGGGLPLGPGGNHQIVIGGMVDASENGYITAAAGNGDGTTSSARQGVFGSQAHATVADGAAVNARFDFVSMDADGFTVDHVEADNDRTLYMAIECTNVAMGTIQTTTSPADFVVSGLGFSPAAIMFLSHNGPENLDDSAVRDAILSIGMATTPSERRAQCYQDRFSLATSEDSTAINFDQVYLRLSTGASPVIVASMDLKSIDADGFTATMDDPEPSPAPGSAQVVWIAFGPAEEADVPGKWRYPRQGIPAQGGVRS